MAYQKTCWLSTLQNDLTADLAGSSLHCSAVHTQKVWTGTVYLAHLLPSQVYDQTFLYLYFSLRKFIFYALTN